MTRIENVVRSPSTTPRKISINPGQDHLSATDQGQGHVTEDQDHGIDTRQAQDYTTDIRIKDIHIRERDTQGTQVHQKDSRENLWKDMIQRKEISIVVDGHLE